MIVHQVCSRAHIYAQLRPPHRYPPTATYPSCTHARGHGGGRRGCLCGGHLPVCTPTPRTNNSCAESCLFLPAQSRCRWTAGRVQSTCNWTLIGMTGPDPETQTLHLTCIHGLQSLRGLTRDQLTRGHKSASYYWNIHA